MTIDGSLLGAAKVSQKLSAFAVALYPERREQSCDTQQSLESGLGLAKEPLNHLLLHLCLLCDRLFDYRYPLTKEPCVRPLAASEACVFVAIRIRHVSKESAQRKSPSGARGWQYGTAITSRRFGIASIPWELRPRRDTFDEVVGISCVWNWRFVHEFSV